MNVCYAAFHQTQACHAMFVLKIAYRPVVQRRTLLIFSFRSDLGRASMVVDWTTVTTRRLTPTVRIST